MSVVRAGGSAAAANGPSTRVDNAGSGATPSAAGDKKTRPIKRRRHPFVSGDKVELRTKVNGRVERSSPVIIKDAVGEGKYKVRFSSGELRTVPGKILVRWRHPQNASDITGIIDIPDDAIIGAGSYGEVRKGFFQKRKANRMYYTGRNLKENKEYAVKVQRDEEARKEIRIFRRLGKNLSIGRYYGFGYVLLKNQRRIAMVMELYDKNLDKLKMKTKPEDVPKTFLWVAKELFSALGFLEQKNVIHMDIKPDNIMFDKNNFLKLIDFGMATTSSSINLENMKEEYGMSYNSPGQMYFAWPPEQLLDTGTCTNKWDVYSAAVVLLLFLENPDHRLDKNLPYIYYKYWKKIIRNNPEAETEFFERTQFNENPEIQRVSFCNSPTTGRKALCLTGPQVITRMLTDCLRFESQRPSWKTCLEVLETLTSQKRQSSDDQSGVAAKRARTGSIDNRLKNLRF